MSTFEEIQFSSYQNKQIGLMHQQEDSMVCECNYDPSRLLASRKAHPNLPFTALPLQKTIISLKPVVRVVAVLIV